VSCIVTRTPGFFVPDQFGGIVLEKNKLCMGAAMAGIDDHLQVNHSKFEPWDNIKIIQGEHEETKDWKECVQIFQFCDFEPKFEDDVPPFVLLRDAKDKPILVCFADGDFSSFAEPDGAHSGMYYMYSKQLLKPISTLGRLLKYDLKEIMKEITSDSLENVFSRTAGDCALVFLAANGDSRIHTTTGTGKQFEWGYVSNNYGYEEGAYPETKEEETPVTGGLLKSFGLTAAKTMKAVKDAIKPADAASAIADQLKQAGYTKPPIKSGAVLPSGFSYENSSWYYQCPSSIVGKDERRIAYTQALGKAPQSYNNLPKIKITNPKILDSLDGLLEKQELSLDKAGKETTKDTSTQHLASPQGTATAIPPTAGTTPIVGFIDNKMKQNVQDMMKSRPLMAASIDYSGKNMPDPSKLQPLEMKVMKCTEIMGIPDILATLGWGAEEWAKLGQFDMASINMMIEMRNKILELAQSQQSLQKQLHSMPLVTQSGAQQATAIKKKFS
jgi:hypothetical protein